ncbi:MAG: PAS domain-containing sensor histidine kinase, partial [Rhodoferax sp.]
MPAPRPVWLSPQLEGRPIAQDDANEFARLWQGFMTARMTLALVLLVLQGTLYATSTAHSKSLIAISLAYFAIALASRLFIRPRPLSSAFNQAWIALIGVDVFAFAAMQWI